MYHAFWAPLTAFAGSLLGVWWLTSGRLGRLALDKPNERSLHQVPIPRTGGLGLLAGVSLAWMVIGPDLGSAIVVAATALILVSLADDIFGLPALVRLGTHLAAAGAIADVFMSSHGLPVVVLIAAGIAWATNLYNFMDGSDGLAGGMTFIGFLFYGIAAWFAGNSQFALLNMSIAAAAAAFLVFNFHPARIFMGDVGSVPLGFLAASFGLYGWLQYNWSWWFPVLVFSPFIVDASTTLARRLWQREIVWEAHRDHYYQRLVQLGWGHRKTALAEYALMALCGLCGLAGLAWSFTAQAVLIGVFMIIYLVLIGAIEHTWRGFRTRQ